MTNEYDIGDLVRMSAVFMVGTVPTNPTTTTFKIKIPTGAVTTYVYGVNLQLIKPAPGNFLVDFTPTLPGEHFYYYAGTGACQAVEEASFFVKESEF